VGEFKTLYTPEAEYTTPTSNTYHTYMHLPSDETKRTRQKMTHALAIKPRLTCRPEAEHPRRRAVSREEVTKKQLPAEAPPEAAEKGPGAGNTAEAQNSADTPLQAKNRPPPAFGMRAAVAAVSAAASLDVCKYEFYGFTRDVER
jgi:hypothetical protein